MNNSKYSFRERFDKAILSDWMPAWIQMLLFSERRVRVVLQAQKSHV